MLRFSAVASFSLSTCAVCLVVSSGSASSWTMGTDDSPNVTDDAADEIMDRIVKSATQVPSQRVVPRERKRSRANRKSRKCFGVEVRDSPCRDLLCCSAGRRKGSSELSEGAGGSTCAHQQKISCLTINVSHCGREGLQPYLSNVFAISGQASLNLHLVPWKV